MKHRNDHDTVVIGVEEERIRETMNEDSPECAEYDLKGERSIAS